MFEGVPPDAIGRQLLQRAGVAPPLDRHERAELAQQPLEQLGAARGGPQAEESGGQGEDEERGDREEVAAALDEHRDAPLDVFHVHYGTRVDRDYSHALPLRRAPGPGPAPAQWPSTAFPQKYSAPSPSKSFNFQPPSPWRPR